MQSLSTVQLVTDPEITGAIENYADGFGQDLIIPQNFDSQLNNYKTG